MAEFDISEFVRRTRAEQGLPPHIEDLATLDLLASAFPDPEPRKATKRDRRAA